MTFQSLQVTLCKKLHPTGPHNSAKVLKPTNALPYKTTNPWLHAWNVSPPNPHPWAQLANTSSCIFKNHHPSLQCEKPTLNDPRHRMSKFGFRKVSTSSCVPTQSSKTFVQIQPIQRNADVCLWGSKYCKIMVLLHKHQRKRERGRLSLANRVGCQGTKDKATGRLKND